MYLANRNLLQSVFYFLADKDRRELALTSKFHWKEMERCSETVLTTLRNVHCTDAAWNARVLERLGIGGIEQADSGGNRGASFTNQLWAAKRVYLRTVANNNDEEESSDDDVPHDADSRDGQTVIVPSSWSFF